jgi:hypothetical protein
VLRLAEEDLLCYKPGSLVCILPTHPAHFRRSTLGSVFENDKCDYVGIAVFHNNTFCRTSTRLDEVNGHRAPVRRHSARRDMLDCCRGRLATMPCLSVYQPASKRCLSFNLGAMILGTVKSSFSCFRSSCLLTGHVLIKPERKDVGALWRSGGLLAELTDVE